MIKIYLIGILSLLFLIGCGLDLNSEQELNSYQAMNLAQNHILGRIPQYYQHEGFNLRLLEAPERLDCAGCWQVVYSFEIAERRHLPESVIGFNVVIETKEGAIHNVSIQEISDGVTIEDGDS
ncbi:MAG: hypothetical protein ACMXYE_01345 [Candidatus Woesearchaeota archaeon]